MNDAVDDFERKVEKVFEIEDNEVKSNILRVCATVFGQNTQKCLPLYFNE
jgi:hypothetical protein